MKKRKKILYPVLLVLMLSMMPAMPVSAGEGGFVGITPSWLYTSYIDIALNFDGTRTMIDVYVSGQTGTTKVTGKVTLSEKVGSSWTVVKTWDNLEETGRTFLFSDGNYTAKAGTTYKITFDCKVYAGSNFETINGLGGENTCTGKAF